MKKSLKYISIVYSYKTINYILVMVKYFYVVRKGRNQGIFDTWKECRQQVDGYSNADYKKFSNVEIAEDFLNNIDDNVSTEIKIESLDKKKRKSKQQAKQAKQISQPKKLGVDEHGDDIYELKKGGGKRKSKDSESKSKDENESKQISSISFENLHHHKSIKKSKSSSQRSRTIKNKDKKFKDQFAIPETDPNPVYDDTETDELDKDTLYVYTDGSCKGNGKIYAKAGVGVFFGPDDPRNVSERLQGRNLTNNIAELTAIVMALKIIGKEIGEWKRVRIFTDSEYSKNTIYKFAPNYMKNGWRTAAKKPIKNREIIEEMYTLYLKHKHKVKFIHIRSHTGKQTVHYLGNDMADRLADAQL
jgi:ribonuclease HI